MMQFEGGGEEWTHSRGFAIPGHGLFVFSNLAEEPASPDDEVTRITRISEDRLGTFFLPWVARSLQLLPRTTPTMVFIGIFGEFAFFENLTERSGVIDATRNGPGLMGVIRAASLIDNWLVAVGMCRQAYSLRSDDLTAAPRWRRIDQATLSPPSAGRAVGFNTVDGLSTHEIYAAGLQGEIWAWTGDTWTRVDSPTNVSLECMAHDSNGFIYVGGRNGILLRGRGEQWEPVEHDSTDVDFWCAHWFMGRLLLASTRAVFELGSDNRLTPILDANKIPSVTCGWITSLGNKVYSIGPAHVLQSVDLKTWVPVAE
jgi:hypothetical protein